MTREEITPENLINNMQQLGPYSRFYLAEVAFKHYYGWYRGMYEIDPVQAINEMSEKEPDWDKLIERYHQEEGYTEHSLNPDFVNKF